MLPFALVRHIIVQFIIGAIVCSQNTKMAKKSVASGPKESHYVVPFRTRCAPKQLMEVCRILKRDEDKMRRLKAIGLDKLVNISCPQINRDLCREFMRFFDTPTNSIRIRGETRTLGPNDVKTFLGLPCGKKKLKINIKDDDKNLKELRRTFGKIPYKDIANWLVDDVDNENFEFFLSCMHWEPCCALVQASMSPTQY